MHYPKAFQALIAHFSKLPSIGPKMAERLVLHLFKQDEEKLLSFAEALENLKHLSTCKRCFHIAESEFCEFCSDPRRDEKSLCVVEEPMDVIAIERTGSFQGLYHVIGGTLDPGETENGKELHVSELLERVKKDSVQEVILATNPTTEGDLTALYLKSKLKEYPVKVTRIARGLSTGGDIEYADEVTLTSSLTNRQELV
ncbi:MAG: recombination mediator RecR [Candidatus Moraniibacteriota bacterium]